MPCAWCGVQVSFPYVPVGQVQPVLVELENLSPTNESTSVQVGGRAAAIVRRKSRGRCRMLCPGGGGGICSETIRVYALKQLNPCGH